MKILLIEDDAMLRQLLTEVLMEQGFEVVTAADGGQGIAYYRDCRPDMVVTDIFMDGKDGIEAIRTLREISPAVKIIAISGGSPRMPYDALKVAKSLGARKVLYKPFRNEDLVSAVKELAA